MLAVQGQIRLLRQNGKCQPVAAVIGENLARMTENRQMNENLQVVTIIAQVGRLCSVDEFGECANELEL